MNLQSLNDEQLKAVTSPVKPTIVLAGAGSGKTRVLTNRILYLVQECGVLPSQILAITFTNKAADEMKRRLYDFNVGAQYMHISTIHSFCATVLRNEAKLLDRNSNFTIYAEDEKKSVVKKIVKEMIEDPDAKVVDSYCESISSIKNNAPELLGSNLFEQSIKDEYLSAEFDRLQAATLQTREESSKIICEYASKMAENNALDFDDLLYYTYKLFSTNNEILEKYREKFKYILIDEFQDTNKVQYKIFSLLGKKYGNIFVVGDDDQSIYSWRGADTYNLKRFESDFENCQVFKLEQNYRSTKQILDVANKIIEKNKNRFNKVLWTENDAGVKPQLFDAYQESDEAYYVVEQIKNIRAISPKGRWKDFAILMRVNALTRSFEQELQRNHIPYKIFGGFKFYERKEIKDILAYLRLIVNPFDKEAFIRAINVPIRRGIGDTTLKKLFDLSVDLGIPMLDVLSCEDNLETFNKTTRQKLLNFYALIENLCKLSETLTIDKFVHEMLEILQFRQVYEQLDEDERLLNIDEFEQSVIEFQKTMPKATLSDYLQMVTLSSDIDESNDTDYVTVATIHAVKGLEFNTVFVVGLESGIFPTSRSTYGNEQMQEERRLMYVAVTRAEKRLYLTHARSRFLWGSRNNNPPSPFFNEVKNYLTPVRPPASESQLANDAFLDNLNRREQVAPKVISGGKSILEIKKFKPGQKVEHGTFGKGIILRISGEIADIAFDSVGKKSLNLKFAPLNIIE